MKSSVRLLRHGNGWNLVKFRRQANFEAAGLVVTVGIATRGFIRTVPARDTRRRAIGTRR
ncbi:hypothetical protein [Methylobacterium phyllostachyos]|uniref:hypothetical protein n=1 Tax=Methylobacterium phyllostachyos TaxID=582672 RepID=UPI000B8A5AA5|nr:hypothetical protein [Methylobacterium phyllostachyos]